MRIFIIDMFGCRYPDLGHQIKAACEQLGHEVRCFDYRKWKLQHFSFTNKILNRMMVSQATSWPADLVLVNKGETILPGTIAAISKAGIKTANWEPDEPFGDLQAFNALKNIPEYDAFFIYDQQFLPRLKELNPHSYYLPPGADPFGVHQEQIPLEKREFPADLCMVGSAYENRIKLLTPYVGRSMRLAGPSWERAPAELAKMALPPVKITEMVRLFNESKIVLNPYGAAKSFIVPNPRTFEIPASRSFELTDARRDVDKFLAPGKEIVIYKDENEFKELVDYYLENNEERNRIAQAGYDRVVKEHTMKHRVQKILTTMSLG